MNLPRLLLSTTLLLAAGCGDDPDQLEVGEAAQAQKCSKYVCMDNSPHIGALPFFELDATGEEPTPDGGLRIVGFYGPGGESWQVDIGKRSLGGIGTDGTPRTGTALIGSTLQLYSEVLKKTFVVRITAVNSVQYWQPELGDPSIESYTMWYHDIDTPADSRRLCPKFESNSIQFPNGYDALVFRGDRYNRTTGAVSSNPSVVGNWFTIGCAGDSLAKLLLIRHAEAAADKTHATTDQQREAALRMFRADYCGTGKAHTIHGQPLDWANRGGWNTLTVTPPLPGTVEAIWRADGAKCLNVPRLEFPDDCAPPPCLPIDLATWKTNAALLSVNP